jgi:hypothetical protein
VTEEGCVKRGGDGRERREEGEEGEEDSRDKTSKREEEVIEERKERRDEERKEEIEKLTTSVRVLTIYSFVFTTRDSTWCGAQYTVGSCSSWTNLRTRETSTSSPVPTEQRGGRRPRIPEKEQGMNLINQ